MPQIGFRRRSRTTDTDAGRRAGALADCSAIGLRFSQPDRPDGQSTLARMMPRQPGQTAVSVHPMEAICQRAGSISFPNRYSLCPSVSRPIVARGRVTLGICILLVILPR